jgi:hypothetical protein
LTLLDRLLQKFEYVLKRNQELEIENLKLKEEVLVLKQREEVRLSLKEEEESNIQELTSKLEKLLSA